HDAREDLEEGRLAGTVRPDQADRLTGLRPELHVPEGPGPAARRPAAHPVHEAGDLVLEERAPAVGAKALPDLGGSDRARRQARRARMRLAEGDGGHAFDARRGHAPGIRNVGAAFAPALTERLGCGRRSRCQYDLAPRGEDD